MPLTNFLAWWGAILSTIVFGWDVYKYFHAGPKLRLGVSTGMQSVGMPQYEGKTLIIVNVTNVGDRPTTITQLAFQGFEKRWVLFKKKVKGQSGLIVTPSTVQPLPFELKPGTVWTGIVIQEKSLEAWPHPYVMILHSHTKTPLSKRIEITTSLP